MTEGVDAAELDGRGDHLLTLLRRAGLEGLEKEELLDSSGFEPADFRAGIANLEERGLLSESADHYVAADLPDLDVPPGEAEVGAAEPSGEQADVEPMAPIASAPATGPMYRAHFTLAVQFGATRGENRDEQAQKRAEGIGRRLAEFTGGSVELDTLEAYDAARIVFPADPDVEP